jgi:hypothetical protein
VAPGVRTSIRKSATAAAAQPCSMLQQARVALQYAPAAHDRLRHEGGLGHLHKSAEHDPIASAHATPCLCMLVSWATDRAKINHVSTRDAAGDNIPRLPQGP